MAFCELLVHRLPAPGNSILEVFFAVSRFPPPLLFQGAELSLLGEMRKMHNRRPRTHLAAVSSSVPPENHTGMLHPLTSFPTFSFLVPQH